MCGFSTSTTNTYELFRLSSFQTKVNRYVYLLNRKISLLNIHVFFYSIPRNQNTLFVFWHFKEPFEIRIDFRNFLLSTKHSSIFDSRSIMLRKFILFEIQYDTFREDAFQIVIQTFRFIYETSVTCIWCFG